VCAQTQKGAIDRFVVKDQSTTRNSTTELDADGSIGVEAHTSEIDGAPNNVEPNTSGTDEAQENANGVDATLNGSVIVQSNDDLSVSFQSDIFDPRYWDSLNQNQINILLLKGPKRDSSIHKGPKDKFSRRFTIVHYTRILPNKEKCDRDLLVYCKELDRIFCFCCKLLKKGHGKDQLQNEGFCDWAHISIRLKKSMKLLLSMSPTWLLGENCVLDVIKIKPLIKFLRENLRKKKTIRGKSC
jgi:hypothetical protein